MQYQHDDVRKRAQAACSVNISYFCQNYDDIDSLSDLIPFNIGLSKVDAFYNEIFDDKEIIHYMPKVKKDLANVLDSSATERGQKGKAY